MVTAATLSGVTKVFGSGDNAVRAVADVDLEVRGGEITALIGASGSGKSTLLTLLVGWDRPDTGQVTVRDPAGRPKHPLQLGWDVLAVMPQALGLLDDLSMRDNVLLPARARRREGKFAARADALCDRLGVAHLADRRPGQTSLGEQQRVCLARTLLLTPRLVVVDEPSAHQDRGFVDIMIETLRTEAARGAAVLLATHNPDMTARSDRVVRMSDGRLTEEVA